MRSDRITEEEAAEEPRTTEAVKTLPVYRAITEHQRGAEWWANREKLIELRQWGQALIRLFGIKIKDAELLPLPLIKVERLNIRTISTYRAEPDGYAISGTIVVNEKCLYLKDMPAEKRLASLLKALFRAWRDRRCRDDLFNEECCKRWKGMGLSVTKSGMEIEDWGRVLEILRNGGVKIPADEEDKTPSAKPKRAGRSTNKLFSCRCQRGRIGTAEFKARCLCCGLEFQPGDHVTSRRLNAACPARAAG